MRTTIIILLFVFFFSGISKERRLWIAAALGEKKNGDMDIFSWVIQAEDKKDAERIYLRDRMKCNSTYNFKVLNGEGLTTNYAIWEITDSIIHKE